MSTSILATKLYVPSPQPKIVLRPRLLRRLNEGLQRKLTLISAPAGFGKTTLVTQWVADCQRPVAWLSLDEDDNDLPRFLAYLIAALQTIKPAIGQEVLPVLQSPQAPPAKSVLTAVINEITSTPDNFILVLDDYHLIDNRAVDEVLSFLLEHLPPQLYLVIATRENPPLPLARYRVRGQLTELRAADLRFTLDEAVIFFNQMMGLDLSAADIAALETRTEGWIAGLQLAALALHGQLSQPEQPSAQAEKEAARFIQSFSGSHHFVLDYLVEEVLQQQPATIQTFLLQTSILDRLCAPLCEAVLPDFPLSGQEVLAYLEQANLFIVPLDNERHWYRYHHLFANFLRQRLQKGEDSEIETLHGRASQWFEDNGLELEAFHHAAAANDMARAERLIEGRGMPLYYRGMMTSIMNWLASLPTAVLAQRPSLQVIYAAVRTMTGQPLASIEETLQAAEATLQTAESDDKTRDLIGQIAAIRAMLAIPHNDLETISEQSRRALAYLHPENLPVRTNATWTLGLAYQLQGDHAAAIQAFTDVIEVSQASGNLMVTIAASTCLGQVQEAENRLQLAADSFQRCLELAGDPPWPAACEAYLGLARIYYQWNELEAAGQYASQSLQLGRQLETVDTPALGQVLLARLKLAAGDVSTAAGLLAQAEHFLQQRDVLVRLPEVAAAQVLVLLQQGDLETAVQLANRYELPRSQARIHLAQGHPERALAVLEPWQQQAEAKGWQDERLRLLVLQAVAYQAQGETDTAVDLLQEALSLAMPGGFIRLFVDEGPPLAALLKKMQEGVVGAVLSGEAEMKEYINQLLAAFAERQERPRSFSDAQPLIEPLSRRELEILQLIAQGLTNREIGERLFLALDTVKGHNRRIFGKLQVQRRTEAVVRAQELGLL